MIVLRCDLVAAVALVAVKVVQVAMGLQVSVGL
jgi:hypothetical protein